MGKEDGPGVTGPFVEIDRGVKASGLSGKVWGLVPESHQNLTWTPWRPAMIRKMNKIGFKWACRIIPGKL